MWHIDIQETHNQAYRSIVGVSTLQSSLLSCCWQILARKHSCLPLLARFIQHEVFSCRYLPFLASAWWFTPVHADLRWFALIRARTLLPSPVLHHRQPQHELRDIAHDEDDDNQSRKTKGEPTLRPTRELYAMAGVCGFKEVVPTPTVLTNTENDVE